jgi:hypothetical protein
MHHGTFLLFVMKDLGLLFEKDVTPLDELDPGFSLTICPNSYFSLTSPPQPCATHQSLTPWINIVHSFCVRLY